MRAVVNALWLFACLAPLFLKTLLSVYTAAEFVELLCRKQVKSAQRNFPANATDFADIPL